MKYLNDSIFTVVTINSKGVYPVAHVIKMKSGVKLVDSMGRSYEWLKDLSAVISWYKNQ